MAASITSPFAKGLREGIIDTENQQILKASNPIFIDAGLTSEHQGPILFWNDKPEKMMFSIENKGEKVISSTKLD